jgi:hypothetical protein
MAKPIPFSFVLDMLARLDPLVKPMFGCHAIYIGPKMVMMLRKKNDSDSGVWVATSEEHYASVKKDFPSMRPVDVLGGRSSWYVLPEEDDDFESMVIKACDLILLGDPRIGKIPKGKKKK